MDHEELQNATQKKMKFVLYKKVFTPKVFGQKLNTKLIPSCSIMISGIQLVYIDWYHKKSIIHAGRSFYQVVGGHDQMNKN